MSDAFEPPKLPKTSEDAVTMALLREQMARECLSRDMEGSAKEYKLTALLLRHFGKALEFKAVTSWRLEFPEDENTESGRG